MTGPVHQVRGILAVVDGELRIEPHARRILAQQARADGVEGARVFRCGRRRGFRRQATGEKALDAADKLGRRAAREGREHDPLRVRSAEDERGDPVGEHRRLAGACARDDEQRQKTFRRADPVLDREPLLGVEFEGRVGANQGEGHGRDATMFRRRLQGRAPPGSGARRRVRRGTSR